MIREVKDSNYEGLMTLYMRLHDSPSPENQVTGMDLWRKILTDKRHHIIVTEEDGKVISSCICMVILNLTHTQRPYTLIESVITDGGYRKKGLAAACFHYVKKITASEDCYKIMLLTGVKAESTLNFHEQVGYNRDGKTVLIQWL